ncbi:Type I inositol 1,4,5-trisphosphate 5-phosphatase, partial [Trichinella britovi]
MQWIIWECATFIIVKRSPNLLCTITEVIDYCYFFLDYYAKFQNMLPVNSYVTVKGDLHESANQSKNVDFERIGGNTENPVGFMMTRWLLHNKSFDFVNLILSPDNSPLDGCLNWPSENSHRRRHEFSLILERLETYMNEECVVFFGNFNCSIDCERFLKDQMNLNKARIVENDNNDQLEAYDLSLRKIFTVTRTQFNFHENHDWLFGTCNGQLVRKYDCELEPFLKGSLYEPNIYFAPTDPYELGPTFGKEPNFVRTECPAWRSRILINQRTREKIHHDSFSSSGLYYGLVGEAEYLGQSKCAVLNRKKEGWIIDYYIAKIGKIVENIHWSVECCKSQTRVHFDRFDAFFAFDIATPVEFAMASFGSFFKTCNIASTAAEQTTTVDSFGSFVTNSPKCTQSAGGVVGITII